MFPIWWIEVESGWRRLDGWRIETLNKDMLRTGPWFALAYAPGASVWTAREDGQSLVKGLDAARAMALIDALAPLDPTAWTARVGEA